MKLGEAELDGEDDLEGAILGLYDGAADLEGTKLGFDDNDGWSEGEGTKLGFDDNDGWSEGDWLGNDEDVGLNDRDGAELG